MNCVGKNVTRRDLVSAISQRTGVSRATAAVVLEAMLEETVRVLKDGSSLKIAKFGAFVAVDMQPRLGRNLKTGQPHMIEARKAVRFRPSGVLMKRVSEQHRLRQSLH